LWYDGSLAESILPQMQPRLEQTCPALFAKVCLVTSEKSGPLVISLFALSHTFTRAYLKIGFRL
jgi:hypothetical protein